MPKRAVVAGADVRAVRARLTNGPRRTVALFLSMFVSLCSRSAAVGEDTVFLAPSAPHAAEARLIGEVIDYKGSGLQMRLAGGVERDFPAARVRRIETDRSPDYLTGLRLYEDGKFNEALARYRAAQIGRNRRITAWVRETLDELQRRGGTEMERGFVVHRTMADPRWLDPTLEPNERRPHWCYLGNPETVNVGPVGLARFSTLRSWLSQWSYDDSRADGPANAARISVPFLLVANSADDAVPASHAAANFAAVASVDKEMVTIQGATHYYLNQPAHLVEAVAVTRRWLAQRGLAKDCIRTDL